MNGAQRNTRPSSEDKSAWPSYSSPPNRSPFAVASSLARWTRPPFTTSQHVTTMNLVAATTLARGKFGDDP